MNVKAPSTPSSGSAADALPAHRVTSSNGVAGALGVVAAALGVGIVRARRRKQRAR